jgi:hypothetical protein
LLRNPLEVKTSTAKSAKVAKNLKMACENGMKLASLFGELGATRIFAVLASWRYMLIRTLPRAFATKITEITARGIQSTSRSDIKSSPV